MFNLNSIVNSLFSGNDKKKIGEFSKIAKDIDALEPVFEKKTQEDLITHIEKIKAEIKDGASIDEFILEAFAIVREAAKRTLGQRHFNVQLIGGMILHNGGIAEMKTGEGKTLVSTLAAFLNSLTDEGVHIVTVNDYLARRDSEWMGNVFKYLGLTVGCLTNDVTGVEERQKQYNCDITYGTNNEFGFDYLRDNLRVLKKNMVQRSHNFCIVDEVDSILIDESRTPLVISGAVEDKTTLYNSVNKIIPFLDPEDYEIDEKTKTGTLTDKGNDKAEKILKEKNIITEGTLYDVSNVSVVHHINQALRANKLFEKDRDYIVKSGSVIIVDEFTGRTMEGRRYGDGLHQAIEAKENVKVQNESQTLASITYQNYFRLYKKISGMTGTALTEAEEFADIYNLPVFAVPTNTPIVRKDNEDEIYRTSEEKYDAIIKQVVECSQKNQPVLIGTTSIDKSEKISKKLKNAKINHEVLNAKQHESEAKIIANAGEPGAVTIATNMAGRGTDIQLGGNFEFNKKQMKDHEGSDELKNKISLQNKSVIDAGGLYVIGSERHESRRIDNQLRGRSGRQGDPGETKFFISLEDDLMRIFGSERIDSVLKSLGLKEGESIQHAWISKALERAQKKVEGRNFDIRKTLLKFDDVLNDQRKTIFDQRLELMNADDISEIAKDMQYDVADDIINQYAPEKAYIDQWNIDELSKEITQHFSQDFNLKKIIEEEEIDHQGLKDKIYKIIDDISIARAQNHSKEKINAAEKMVLLKILDDKWKDHINNLEQLRSTIGLRGYGQRDPLNEYKNEAFSLFEGLINNLKTDVTKIFSRMRIRENTNLNIDNDNDEVEQSSNEPIKKDKKISRNSPCPCGSGKKYKHCHGNIS